MFFSKWMPRGLAAAAIVTACFTATTAQAVPFSTTVGPFVANTVVTPRDIISVPTTISGDLTFEFAIIGDLFNVGERFAFLLDNLNITGTVCNNNDADDVVGFLGSRGIADACQDGTEFVTASIQVANADIAPLIADGELDVVLAHNEDNAISISIPNPVTLAGVTFSDIGQNAPSVFGFTVSFDDGQPGGEAVPEPGALALLGLGLIGLARMRRRT